ncbi:arf-GAP with Rho-GAP domain, ANK repeat and PH domain-containing protein 1-like isoform X3 [Montipora foliosa]|uniref:arf-GAP with Rho-GAP domain, ANK repeat and PH domain-containing protein 1-like isoform X3 n=1 Tax=Montipora foliosa TaxID=591990 RepID=UPI0035F18D89
MEADDAEIVAVKEWLSNEVKLDRYADKLVSNGFISLETCCSIDENVLDDIGIVLPYHRRRLLQFVEKLRDKLCANVVINNEMDNVVTSELLSNGAEEGNKRENLLISFDVDDESNQLDCGPAVKGDVEVTSQVCSVAEPSPSLPPKLSKRPNSEKNRPPPIPPRRDLDEVTGVGESADSVAEAQDLVKQPGSTAVTLAPVDVPKRKAPVKPPRKTITKAVNENKPEMMPNTSEQSTTSFHLQEHSDVSVRNDFSDVFDPLKQKETPADGSSLGLITTENVNSKTSEEQGVKECLLNRSTDLTAAYSPEPTEPLRPAPKLPTRTGSKKPIPVPRVRRKSENGVLETAMASDKANDENGVFPTESNHFSPSRTMSFQERDNRVIVSDNKPSTLPRSNQSIRRAAPPLPSRQSSSSLKDKVFPNVPLPPVPTAENSEKPKDELLVVHQQGDKEESFYESVDIERDLKAEEHADYSSDDSLEGFLDDLPDPEFKLQRSESVDSTDHILSPRVQRSESDDSTDDHRISRSILSPRVRKREGYLYKQGGLKGNKGWKKRWFVFNGTNLKYYKDKNNLNVSLHIIPVSQMRDIELIRDLNKRPAFKVITPNRVFILASESTTEVNLWSQTLMEAIITSKGDWETVKSGGDMADPDKEGWLKKQGHNVVGDWRNRYVAVKDDKICYYDSHDDFNYATPINCINAALAKVKAVEGNKNRFVIITFMKNYCFQADSELDTASWIVAIETAIQIGLGDRTILEKVWENPSNRYCADCGMKDPVWASINFCVCVCAKCIGVHRNLGVHCSRARSLLMDEKIWNPALVELMIKIGNDQANQLLEHKLPEDDKISPAADSSTRREFIYCKYWEKKYCKYHQSFGNAAVLGKFLRDTVVTDDVVTTMELILNKVDVQYIPPDSEGEKTPLEVAEEAGQSLQAELLRQNGGEGKLEMPNSNDDQVRFETPQSVPFVEVVYEKEGFLYKKEATWKKKWFLLKDRQLKYARGPHEKDDLVVIDLTTVTSLVKCPKGEVLQMDIVTVDRTHSLKADTEEELDAWFSALRNKQVFGVLLSQQDLGSDGIPHLVAKCLQFVETYGGLEMEGVYRVNGGQLTMKKLRTLFDQDAGRVLLTLDECGVHDVTGILKQYLRELPDPVIPGHVYKLFITAGLNQDHNTRLIAIKDLINQLPKVNHDTLKIIIFHLTKVVELVTINKMGLPNVAMIFGPTLMSNEKTGRMDDTSINQEFSIVGDMINYYQWLFDVGEDEVLKDQVIQQAKEKIRKLNEEKQETTSSTGGEFTLDIYVKEKNDNPCRMKVSSEMSAGRLCEDIVSQMNLARNLDWALFEVIDNGALERAFQVREKVLAAANWGSGNFLIVKENYIAEQIAPHVGWLSIEGTLHIREPKKNWKQSHVCLKHGYLSISKEKGLISKATREEQWPLHKLTLFVGIPSEKATKGIDTSCGFTVVIKTDQEEITRYLCVKEKRDRDRWLAAILNMKHPEGIWSDPTHTDSAAAVSPAEAKQAQEADELPMYLGRQSMLLRRKGSSKKIMEELKFKQKSLRRSAVGGFRT